MVGTLFLDETHLLSREVQGHLLQVLNSGKYRRLGDNTVRESNFRLITAASSNLKELSESRDFMPDLWYRISGKTLTVPALSERRACIPRLMYKVLKQVSEETGLDYEVETTAMDRLVSFSWGGNIRDLGNSIRALCSDAAQSGKITLEMVKEDLMNRAGSFADEPMMLTRGENLEKACNSYEISLISKALRINKNNISLAARSLDIPRTTLRRRMERLGVRI